MRTTIVSRRRGDGARVLGPIFDGNVDPVAPAVRSYAPDEELHSVLAQDGWKKTSTIPGDSLAGTYTRASREGER